MYPFWNTIIEPALQAAGATRVVEIGALRGETTVRLLELLGPESELHVIDPVPIFDPDEHAKRFPGRYIFHRDISHNVLPELPPADAALIDGDHNWFTVYHELRMLRETARAAGATLPLLILHDVCWPYGRRDLYYAPGRIPDEFRQPHATRGILAQRRELVEEGGLNQHLENAIEEGGPRNGVMTALDDFCAEHDRPLRRVLLPIYFGLTLVADRELLEERPALAELFDELEEPEARYEQLQLAESIRLNEQVHHHNSHYALAARARRVADLYLDLLKSALLDEHYLENELRIDYLLDRIAKGVPFDAKKLRDPGRYMGEELVKLKRERRSGEATRDRADENGGLGSLPYTAAGRARLDHLEQCLDTVREEAVEGDLVECGTHRGGAGIFLRGYLQVHEMPSARLWIADRFGGGSPPGADDTPSFAPDLNIVRDGFDRFGLLDDDVTFLQGPFAETLPEASIERIALLRIDGDPDEVGGVLETLYDKVAVGGFIVIDGYADPGCQAVVEGFRRQRGTNGKLERVAWDGACWRKAVRSGETPEDSSSTPLAPASLAPARIDSSPQGADDSKQLSVVVVLHNMRREAARTLYSLTRKYQEGIERLDYEVIVVENGSDSEERLGEDYVRRFGPEFRYLNLGEEATPSPAPALNRGIEASSGRTLALMIDGAHVLTPGVLRLGMLGLESYRPALVATQQWYVGPGQQNEALAQGYDQDYEDQLFKKIRWPTDGYALFEIGHFIGDRDWFEDQWESNCIFLPRKLLRQFGEMDESFSQPGGGFVNLDFFERMANSPGVTLVSPLGEGSFHQLHGGTTTNVAETAERSQLIDSYHDQYEHLRGRRFYVPPNEVHYVGSLPKSARRTKPRRMGAPVYFQRAHVTGPDGRPEKPSPVPQDLRTDFIDAFWRSKEWESTSWLGKWTNKPATDLVAYQELLYRVRPNWVIETRTGGGARAFFLATICDLIGNGQVLSIDDYPVEKLAEHPRITYLRRDPADEEAGAEAREIVGPHPRGLLILGLDNRSAILSAFDNYSPLVPPGSYVVVENTIVNGRPVWPGFGPGPWEAVGEITDSGEFTPDHSLERQGLTFNPGGYLKRVRSTSDEPGDDDKAERPPSIR